jgi:hypothetical protein
VLEFKAVHDDPFQHQVVGVRDTLAVPPKFRRWENAKGPQDGPKGSRSGRNSDPLSRRYFMGRYLVIIFGIYTRDVEVLDYIPSPLFGIVFRASGRTLGPFNLYDKPSQLFRPKLRPLWPGR